METDDPVLLRATELFYLYLLRAFFDLFFRSGVLFLEYDKTSDLKVSPVISALCEAHFGILWMHCSFTSQNLLCFKWSIIWKTSASMSKASRIDQITLCYYLETPHLWFGAEEIILECAPKSFGLSVASISFSPMCLSHWSPRESLLETRSSCASSPGKIHMIFPGEKSWKTDFFLERFPWSRWWGHCVCITVERKPQLAKGRKIGKLISAHTACVIP